MSDINAKNENALDWLNHAERFGIKLNLENIQSLCEILGHPQQKVQFIHIAGTNGKGSTSAMIASVLKEAGYKTGLYTSPHLISPCERIQLNGQQISTERLTQELSFLKNLIRRLGKEQDFSPTYFEIMTAVALKYFADEKVDYAVLETGMGGRLDSTNIVPSRIQVITHIDFDHTRYLGSTMADIAREKAGIIKSRSVVVTGAKGEALKVIEDHCRELQSQCFRLYQEIRFEEGRGSLEGQKAVIHAKNSYPVELSLLGYHQIENCALAIGALEAVSELYASIAKEAVLKGLQNTKWPGRFEVFGRQPLIIMDAAHNPAGAQVLVKTWKEYLGDQKADLVFSALADKDIKSMVKTLSEIAGSVFLVELSNPRRQTLDALEKIWQQYLPKEKIISKKIQDLPNLLRLKSSQPGPFLVTGSIFLLGEILSVLGFNR